MILSGSKGFVKPNIVLGAFSYCMLRLQFAKTFTNTYQFVFTLDAFPKRCNKLSSVSVQKVHASVSFNVPLKRKEFVAVILWESLN